MQVFHGKECRTMDTNWEEKNTSETFVRILPREEKIFFANIEARLKNRPIGLLSSSAE